MRQEIVRTRRARLIGMANPRPIDPPPLVE
jgi:hypothetical protein